MNGDAVNHGMHNALGGMSSAMDLAILLGGRRDNGSAAMAAASSARAQVASASAAELRVRLAEALADLASAQEERDDAENQLAHIRHAVASGELAFVN